MKKLIHILLIVLGFAFNSARAQDFHLSMYDAGPLFLNPALTGVVDADFRVHAQYRNQWRSVAFKPYNTALISIDIPRGKWGFGLQVTEMRAGVGNYNVLQGVLSTAYSVPLDREKYNHISLGIQAGATQKRIESALYTFDNQYNTSNGGFFDKSMASGENFNTQQFITPQVNAGFMYFYSKQQARLNPFVGYSAFNLTNPRETYFNTDNKLPIRHYIQAGLRININELFYILPKALLMLQTNASEQTYACDLGYFLKNEEMYLLGGLTYRYKDAGICYVGIRKNNYIAKIAYDANTSGLRDASKYRGAFELSFTYMGKKSKGKEVRHCPRL